MAESTKRANCLTWAQASMHKMRLETSWNCCFVVDWCCWVAGWRLGVVNIVLIHIYDCTIACDIIDVLCWSWSMLQLFYDGTIKGVYGGLM